MPAFGVKTNERPGTRAQARYVRMSAYKARQVLDLIRDKEVQQADEILQFAERDAAIVIRKVLASAMANAENNDGIDPAELFVSACFADEGPTLKRWRPRARGRATRIRKRTCHITIIVSRLSEAQLERRRRAEAASPSGAGRGRRRAQAVSESRRQRVAKSRQREQAVEEHDHDEHDHEHDDVTADELETAAVETDAGAIETDTDAVESDTDAVETEAPEVEAEAEVESPDAEEEEK
ncbi:MAG: large subunit ribosomal protein [Acidimicrobiaceae bacterium]